MKYGSNYFSKEAQRAKRVVRGQAVHAQHRSGASVQKIIDRV